MGFHTLPNKYIKQITLNVSDLEKSIPFYTNLLGFKLQKMEGKSAELSADGINPLVTLRQPEGVHMNKGRTSGLYHFAILLPTRESLGGLVRHMLQQGYSIGGASDHLVSEALYFNDPDGNGIEIYHDRPREQWEWQDDQVRMETLPLDGEGLLEAGKGHVWAGLPAETVIGHIHLHVADLTKAADFYRDALGYEEVCSYGGQALFLSTGKYHHHIAINVWNGSGVPDPEENAVGLASYTIPIADTAALEQLKNSLAEYGYSFTTGESAIRVKDHSGSIIQFEMIH
ncbi:MAG: VOC family protein [Bacillus sp. (in: firmicutes)]